MSKLATWRILSHDAPAGGWTHRIPYDCPRCGAEAELPVQGLAIAQTAAGAIIFDIGNHFIPGEIQCRACRRRFERGD
jgi:hypothetical protein